MGFTLTYDEVLEKNIWYGYPDPDYVWNGDRLKKETKYIDENGKEQTSISYQNPIKITANFNPDTEVSLTTPEISAEIRKKFGGGLIGFVWLDKITGGGNVVLPFTAPHIFKATGLKNNPTLAEINTDSAEDNYYEIIDGKTHIHVSSFSGVGGAAGVPPTLIAHYKMNEDAADKVVADSSGNGHTGASQQNTEDISVTGKINTALDFTPNDYIEIADHDDFTSVRGISAWVYMHDASNFIIVSKGVSGVDGEWVFYFTSADILHFLRLDESVDDCYIGRKFTTFMSSYQNTWIHLVATSDGGTLSSGAKIYLNGIRVDDANSESNAGSFVAVENLGHAVWIGRYSNTYANGLIDNLMLFGVEPTPDEVKHIYNNGHGTETLAEVDEPRLLLRRNNSPFGLRSRYEV